MFFKVFYTISLILFPSLVYSKNLNIVTTIKPLQSIIQNIVGDTTKVDLLVTKSNSPHFYALKPSDLKKIHQANFIFFINEHFELFLSKFIDNKNYKDKFIRLSDNKKLTIYKNRSSKFWDMNDNNHEHEHENHNHEHEHHTHSTEENDFHMWLDTKNVELIAIHVLKVLVNNNPENKELYEKNLDLFLKKLNILETEITKNLYNLKNKKFIVFHDAYQYLDRKYDLSPAGVILLNPMRKSTIKELSSLINKINKQKIKCLFTEPQFPQSIISTIVKNTNINISILDAEWGVDDNKVEDVDAYFYMMRKIVQNMNTCLN